MAVVNDLEFEDRGLADQFLGSLRVLDTWQLDQDFVVALARDGGFANSQLVDPVPNRLLRLVHRTDPGLGDFTRAEAQNESWTAAFRACGTERHVAKSFVGDILK